MKEAERDKKSGRAGKDLRKHKGATEGRLEGGEPAARGCWSRLLGQGVAGSGGSEWMNRPVLCAGEGVARAGVE